LDVEYAPVEPVNWSTIDEVEPPEAWGETTR